MWENGGVYQEQPQLRGLTPLDLFRKSVYATFWFEDHTLKAAIDSLGPDNIVFETDYPHSTSVAPGPNVGAKNPIDHIQDRFGNSDLSKEVVAKLLHGNASALYHIA